MPPKLSAGLMLYRHGNQDDEIVLEVLLGHMGGSFWARKGDGAWSIPKLSLIHISEPTRPY